MNKNEIKKDSTNEITNYREAVSVIKTAILQSQYDAAKSANEKQLMLYYGVGKYISENSRSGFWGTGAIDTISEQLQKELPGLRGFSARNLRNMRMFFEEWSKLDTTSPTMENNLEITTAKLENDVDSFWQLQLPKPTETLFGAFSSIGFTHHITIISKVKTMEERLYYMGVATYKTSKDMSEELRKALPDIEDLKRLLDSEEK